MPTMSNLQLIEAFSQIIEAQARIITEQQKALHQLNAVCMEEEITAVRAAYSGAIGSGEIPED